MRKIFAIIIFVFLISCSKEQVDEVGANGKKSFSSKDFGFTFEYPAEFESITKNLPNNWAANNPSGDTMIFLVSNSEGQPLYDLGISHAVSDIYEKSNSILDAKKIEEATKMVRLQDFSGNQWFTYGVKSNLNINSLVAGTLCKDKEVLMVFVIKDENFIEQGKVLFNEVLNSLKCE